LSKWNSVRPPLSKILPRRYCNFVQTFSGMNSQSRCAARTHGETRSCFSGGAARVYRPCLNGSSRTRTAAGSDKLLPAHRSERTFEVSPFHRTVHNQVAQGEARRQNSSSACIKTKLCVCPVIVSSRNVSYTAATEKHAQAQGLAPTLSVCQTFGCVDARVALDFLSPCEARMAKPRLGLQKSLSTRPAGSCFAGRAIDRKRFSSSTLIEALRVPRRRSRLCWESDRWLLGDVVGYHHA
jgi:hypothetical protein